LQAEKLPRRMWRRIVSVCAPVSSAACFTVIVPLISAPFFLALFPAWL
jgi:hypothetical protein